MSIHARKGTASPLLRRQAAVIRLVSEQEEWFWTVEKHCCCSLDCLDTDVFPCTKKAKRKKTKRKNKPNLESIEVRTGIIDWSIPL